MARTTVEKILSDNGMIQTVEKSYARGKGQEPKRETRTFERPTLAHFVAYISGLSDKPESGEKESPLAEAHRLYISGLDRGIASEVYERAEGTSTIVRIDKKPMDLMSLSLKAFLKGYNGTAMRRDSLLDANDVDEEDREDEDNEIVKAVERNVGWNPWRNAFNKHEAAGKVKLVDTPAGRMAVATEGAGA